jgi:hypothetical protein
MDFRFEDTTLLGYDNADFYMGSTAPKEISASIFWVAQESQRNALCWQTYKDTNLHSVISKKMGVLIRTSVGISNLAVSDFEVLARCLDDSACENNWRLLSNS